MAYGSFGSGYGMEGLTSGFDSVKSDAATGALGSIPGDRNQAEMALASSAQAAQAQYRAQKYLADKQLDAQREANSPGRLLAGIAGQVFGGLAGGFGGGIGKAAGKAWFG